MRPVFCGQLMLGSLAVLVVLARSTSGTDAVRDDRGEGLRAVREAQTLPGIAEPKQQVTLTAPVDGVLMALQVRDGEQAHEGDVLALMDNRVARAAVHLAQVAADRQAAIQRAKNDLKMAERYLQRVTEAADAASEVEVDNAQGNVEQAKVALADALEQARMAESQLQLERARLATHELLAPFDGRILDVEGSKGQSMARAEPILTMANLKTLRVDLHIPMAWYNTLKLGQPYGLLAAEPVGQVLEGTLVASQPVIDAGTRTFRCTFEIDNTDEQWPAGFVVRLAQPHENDISTAKTNTNILRTTTVHRADQRPAAPRGSH